MIPVYCPLCCDQPFEDQDTLFHHLRTLRNNLFCPICSERFSSFDYLVTHLSRKCHGPVSPREAKRKCLYNKEKLPDPLDVLPPFSPNSVGSGNNQGEVPIESSALVRSASVVAASTAPLSVIPPEIRSRLSQGISVSITPLDCPKVKPTIELENENSVNNSSSKPDITGSSLGLDKFSPNHNVEICDKNSKDGNSSENPVSHSASVNIASCSLSRSGPLSSKLRRNTSSSSRVKNDEQLSSKEESCLELNLMNKSGNLSCQKRDRLSIQDEIPSNNKIDSPKKTQIEIGESEIVNGARNQEKSIPNAPQRRRGRPKKNFTHKLTEVVNSKKLPRARRKSKQPFNKLVSSDDSDYVEDEDVVSWSSDESEPKFRSKKRLNSSEIDLNEPGKEGSKTKEKTNEHSDQIAESRLDVNLEKTSVESDNNSTKTQLNNSCEPGVTDVSNVEGANSTKTQLNNSCAPGVTDVSNVEGAKTTEEKTAKDSSSIDPSKADEEEEYTCSACNIRFTSIYEHIKQYHNGQEVVVEVPEEEIQEDLKVYQENSKSSVTIGESDLSAAEIKNASLPQKPDSELSTKGGASLPQKPDSQLSTKGGVSLSQKPDSQLPTKGGDKKKKEITGFSAEGSSDELVYTRTFKKVKQDNEHWVQLQSDKKKMFQFVRDEDKYQILMNELWNNTSIHPEFKMPVRKLFENPKINVIEITYKQNSPYFDYKNLNFKNPMPMFIVDRQTTDNPNFLGGIASYIMADKNSRSYSSVSEDSKVIAVMKVILGSDSELTVENIVFNDKPANPDMVPVLEEVKNPDIPLLERAKILKWRCNRCLATTWKFPLHKESHFCNACPICHKTFISPVSLKKHLVLHKRDGTRYCKECQAAFVSKSTLNKHLGVHLTHISCDKCHLYVLRDNIDEHNEIHRRDAYEQFPCSVCKKVFGSSQEMKCHETKLCAKLVAQLSCSQCDRKFFSPTALAYHTAAHNNAAIKYKCRFCPKIFIQQKEQCPKMAGKRKPSSFIQKIWHERIHTRDRPYMCKSCPKRFRSMEHTMQHSRVHAPIEPHPIPLRNVHVHMCIYCDRVFRSEKHLTSHMAIHSTEHTMNAAE